MRFLLVILIGISIVGCSAKPEPASEEITDPNSIKRFFKDFPEKQFLDVTLGEELAANIEGIVAYNYQKSPDQPNHFVNNQTNIEVVFADADITNAFKVFFYNDNEIGQAQEFSDFFTDQAISTSQSAAFSVFEIETLENDFSVTLFEQQDFLRLSFELKRKH